MACGGLCPASPGRLLGWGAPGVCTEKGRLSLPACPTPGCWGDPPRRCPCARLQLIPDREAAQCLLTRLSISLHPAHSRRHSTGVPGMELHGAWEGCVSCCLAFLAKAGCETDPARFCRFLRALGSAVLFKTACCFSSRRDIISVHKARFIEGWNRAQEFKFRSNTRCDCKAALAHTTFHRYCLLPLLPVPPTRDDNHSSKNAFFFACLFYHPPFPSPLSVSVW